MLAMQFILPTGPRGAPMPYRFADWLSILASAYPQSVFYGSSVAMVSSIVAIIATEATIGQPVGVLYLGALTTGLAAVIAAIYGGRTATERIRSDAQVRTMEIDAKIREMESARREREAEAQR